MHIDDRSSRSGAVLLEVIIALTILATAGLGAVIMVAETGRVVERARAIEREVEAASALMDAVSLWPREDLDRHLGDHPQGAWRMSVDRESGSLYVVTISDTAKGAALISTVLYRKEAANVQD